MAIRIDFVSNDKAVVDSFERIKKSVAEANAYVGRLGGNMGDAFSLVSTQAEAAARSTSKLSQAFGSFFQQYTAANLALQGFFKVKSALGDAVDTIADFQAKQSLLGAILGETNENIKEMTEQAKDLGRTTVFTASQVSQLQIELSKLGFERKPIQEMTQSILAFAQATGGDLGDAAALTGAAIRMFGAQTEEANRYTNAMARATTASALNFQAIRDNLATFGPMAHSIGLQIEDTLALFGIMKNAGIEGSTAMTSLRNIFTKVAQGKIPGMEQGVKTLDEFVKKLKEMADIDPGKSMKLIGPRGGTQFMTLLQQADQILELRDKIKEASSEDTTAGMADQMTNNVNGAIMMMKSAWEGFILSFSESTGPWKDVIDLITKGITNVTNLIATGSTISKEALYAVMTGLGSLITMYGVRNGVVAVSNKLTAEQTLQYTKMVAALEAANNAEAVGYRQELQGAVSKGIITKEIAAKITMLLAESDAQMARMQAEREAISVEITKQAEDARYAAEQLLVAGADEKVFWAEMQVNAERKKGILTTRLAAADANIEALANQKDAAAKMLNAGATGKLRQAIDLLGLSMLKNPYILAATAIAGVAYAIYSYQENMMDAAKAEKTLNDAAKEHSQQLKQNESDERNMIKTIQDKNASLYEQYKAYKELTKARTVFAQYSEETIKAMSQSEIDALFSEDNSRRAQEMIKNRVKALKEYAEWLKKVGATSAWATSGEEEKLKELGKRYNLGDETQKWWESAGWNTNWKEWVKQMQTEAGAQLQEYLEDVAYSGLTDGFTKGFNNKEIQAQASQLIDDFSSITGNITTNIAESYKSQMQPALEGLQERVKEINKELITATGDKKIKLTTELDTINADITTLTSLMAFFDAGVNNKELVVKIQNEKEYNLLGDDKILEIADQYDKAEEIGKKYEVAFEKAADKARETGAATEDELNAIAKELGVTSESVEGDFGKMEESIEQDISNLQKKYEEAKTQVDKEKIKIEIEKKQALLDYINGLKTNLLNLVNNRYTIFIDLAGKAWEELKGMLGIGSKPSSIKISTQGQQPANGTLLSPQWGNNSPSYSPEEGFAWQQGKNMRDKSESDREKGEDIRAKRAAQAAAEAKEEEENQKKLTEKQKKAAEKAAKERADREAKEKQQAMKHSEEMLKLEENARRAREDAEIAGIQNAAQRERKEREAQHKRQIEEIKKQEEEIYKKIYEQRKAAYENANKGKHYENTAEGQKGWQGVIDSKKTADEEKQIALVHQKTLSEMSAANANYARQEVEHEKQRVKAMYDYLREYGTMQEQRLAIAEEYASKIAEAERNAESEWEVKRLAAERDTRIAQANAQSMAMSIDWNQTFQGIGNVLEDIAKESLQKVNEYMQTAEFRALGAEAKKAYQDLKQQLIDAGGQTATNPFSSQTWDEIAKLTHDYKFHVKALADANENHTKAVEENIKAEQRRNEAEKQLEKAQKDQLAHIGLEDQGKYDTAVEDARKNLADATQEVADTFQKVEESGKSVNDQQANVTSTQQQLHQRTEAAAQGLNNFNTVLGQLTSGTLRGFVDGVSNVIAALTKDTEEGMKGLIGVIGQKAGGIIGAILSIIDMLGDKPVEFFDNLFDGITRVIEAVISHIPEIIASVVKGIGNVVAGIGKGIIGMFGDVFGEDNSEEQLKKQDEIRSKIETATRAIDKLTEALEKSYGATAMRNARELEEKYLKNASSQIAGLNEALWSNYGGGHSDYYHWEKNTGDVARQIASNYGLNGGDWWTLFNGNDAEKVASALRDIKENQSEWWRILTTQGYNDGAVEEWLNALIDTVDKMDEAREALDEQLTTTTADNVFDDFLNSLYEFADGSEEVMDDIATNWQKMVNRMVVNNLIGGDMRQQLDEWYKALSQLNRDRSDGLIDDQTYKQRLADIQKDYEDIVKEGQRKIAQFTEDGILKPIQETTEEVKESFNSIRDAWASAVMGMKEDSESLGKEIARIMFEQLVESNVLNDGFDDWLKDWVSRYEVALNVKAPGEREGQLRQLEEERKNKIHELTEATKAYADATGYAAEADNEFSNSLDNLGDTLLDALLDTETDAAEMGKKIAQNLIREMLSEMLASEKYAGRIAKIRQMWQDILSSNDKEHTYKDVLNEIAALNNDIANDEAISSLADQYRILNETTEKAKSAFDGLHDTFLNDLTDMESSVEKFRENLEKTLAKDLIDNLVLNVPLTLDVTRKGEDGAIQTLKEQVFDSFDAYSADWNTAYLEGIEELRNAQVALNESRKSGDDESIASAEKSYKAASAYIDSLINELVAMEAIAMENAEELRKRLQTTVKDTTFTDMESNFVSALMDMDGDIEDFANDMKKTIVQKLVESFMVGEKIKPILDDLQETLNYALSVDDDSWTPEQRAEFIESGDANHSGINDYLKDFHDLQDIVKAIMKAIGYEVKESEKDVETAFSGLGDTILSSLMDVSSGAEGFMKSITDTIARELTESYMATEEFKKGLATVKKDLEDAVKAVGDAEKGVADASKALAEASEGTEEWVAANEQLEIANRNLEAANGQLAEAKDNAKAFYDTAEEGTKRVRDSLQDIVEDTTFKDMTDDFLSALMDMDSDAETWGEKIGRAMATKIVEQMLTIQPVLDNIQNAYADAVKEATGKDGKIDWEAVYNNAGLDRAIEESKQYFNDTRPVVEKVFDAFGISLQSAVASFGDINSALTSSLTDADMTAEKFGAQIGRTMAEQMLESYVANSEWNDKFTKLNEQWNEAVKKGDTAAMERIRQAMVDLYKQMGAEDDTIKEFTNDINGFNDALKEVELPFSNLKSMFVSALTDADFDPEKFANQILSSLYEEMLNEMMDSKYSAQIDAIREMWRKVLKGEENEDGTLYTINDVTKAIDELTHTMTVEDTELIAITDNIKNLNQANEEAVRKFGELGDAIVSAMMEGGDSVDNLRKKINEQITKDLIDKNVMNVPISITYDGDTHYFENGFNQYLEQWENWYNNILTDENITEEERERLLDELAKQMVNEQEKLNDAAENYVKRVKESTVDTTFTDMSDSFYDALMDMENGVTNFAESIKNTIARKLIESFMVGENVKSILDELQKTWDYVLGIEGLSAEDRASMMLNGVHLLDKQTGEETHYYGYDNFSQEISDMQDNVNGLLGFLGLLDEKAAEGFSDLRGSFVSALSDMQSDAATYGKSIAKTMYEQMIDAYIGNNEEWSTQMETLNKQWADALEGGSTAELEEIKQKVVELYEQIGKDETVEELRKKLADLDKTFDETFTGMGDSFVSMMMDFNATADDWGTEIGKTLAKRIIEETIMAKYVEQYLQPIQDAFNKAIAVDENTETDAKTRLEKARDDMAKFVDEAKEAFTDAAPYIRELLNAFGVFADADTTPLDNLRSNFRSALMDMTKDSKSFANDITQTLTEAFIDGIVLDGFDDKLKEWQERYREIMGGERDNEERAALLKQLRNDIGNAKEEYNKAARQIHELMGTNVADQSAYMNTAQSFTYDQGELVSGMMTNLVIGQNQANAVREQILATLQSMQSVTSGTGYGEKISGQVEIANRYLLDIKNEVQLYLHQIASNTVNIKNLS